MESLLETVAPGVDRLELRTPTVPPATTTNTWFVERDGAFYLVEPASPYEEEQRVLCARIRDRINNGKSFLGALLTHHHPDHVGAAKVVQETFSVPLFAHEETQRKLQGRISIDRLLKEGDSFFDGALRVLHTPGHAPGHLCFFDAENTWLIAGDMVASVGTIVIDPFDDGDMRVYLEQLQRLAALTPSLLLPAHGGAIDEAVERLQFYVKHRLGREAKVLRAVQEHPGTIETLVAQAYDDTPPHVWPLAERSLLAHLQKLEYEQKVVQNAGKWSVA